MALRTKSRSTPVVITTPSGSFYQNQTITTEQFSYYTTIPSSSGVYFQSTDCDHVKAIRVGNLIDQNGYRWDKWCDIGEMIRAGRAFLTRATSNISTDIVPDFEFEVIPFILDWDGQLRDFADVFSRRFNSLSYGGVTWGWMPFVGDCNALYQGIRNLSGGITDALSQQATSSYSTRFSYSWSTERYNPSNRTTCRYDFQAQICISGHPTGSVLTTQADILLNALDFIGVHPDLRTMWDVIPLSFVVDYFIPIGDMLETLHPRGWYRPTFAFPDAVYSAHGFCDVSPLLIRGRAVSGVPSRFEFYVRRNGALQATEQSTPTVEWSSPNFRQLFNTWYLLGRNQRRL